MRNSSHHWAEKMPKREPEREPHLYRVWKSGWCRGWRTGRCTGCCTGCCWRGSRSRLGPGTGTGLCGGGWVSSNLTYCAWSSFGSWSLWPDKHFLLTGGAVRTKLSFKLLNSNFLANVTERVIPSDWRSEWLCGRLCWCQGRTRHSCRILWTWTWTHSGYFIGLFNLEPDGDEQTLHIKDWWPWWGKTFPAQIVLPCPCINHVQHLTFWFLALALPECWPRSREEVGNLWQPNQTWVEKPSPPSVVLASDGKDIKTKQN